jgi:hypothetical protein
MQQVVSVLRGRAIPGNERHQRGALAGSAQQLRCALLVL